MSRGAPLILTDEVARFQADLRRFAYQLVHQILRQELARKRAERPERPKRAERAASRPKASRARRRVSPRAAQQLADEQQLSLSLAPAAASDSPAVVEPPPAAPAAPAPAAAEPVVSGKRGRWTRDSIVEELAKWLVGGTPIDPGFMTRHGPPGLVAAARRIFGRFDAALNVASLHVSKLYPDGPPQRRPDQRTLPFSR